MQRRDFLKASASVLVLGPFVIAGTGGAVDPYSRVFFAERVGTWFAVEAAGFIELLAVEDGPASTRLDQFTLQFRGDVRDAFADGTRALRAESGESIALFLQRRADEAAGARYSASFALSRPLTATGCASGA
jgi:hypothetical protein